MSARPLTPAEQAGREEAERVAFNTVVNSSSNVATSAAVLDALNSLAEKERDDG